jgi:hypothetical protein
MTPEQAETPPVADQEDAPQPVARRERTPPPRVQEAFPPWHDTEIDGDLDDDGWCSW